MKNLQKDLDRQQAKRNIELLQAVDCHGDEQAIGLIKNECARIAFEFAEKWGEKL